MDSEVVFRKVKVSDKGQISIPVDLQRKIGIRKGDELLLMRKGRRLVLEEPDKINRLLENEFSDIQDMTEATLSRLWKRKEDDVWSEYLKEKPR